MKDAARLAAFALLALSAFLYVVDTVAERRAEHAAAEGYAVGYDEGYQDGWMARDTVSAIQHRVRFPDGRTAWLLEER